MNILKQMKKWKSQQGTIKLAKELEDGENQMKILELKNKKPMKTSVDRLNSKMKGIEEKDVNF